MKKIILISIFVSLCGFLSAQQSLIDSIAVYTLEDKEIFDDYVKLFEPHKDLPMNQLVMETGFYFLETPYVNFTLEVAKPEEKLIINLRELDCTTFTEVCLALARTIKSEEISFEKYAAELMNIRFRNGVLDGYASRLHYFSDWIYDNKRLGIVSDVTKKVGGINFPLTVNLMTRVSKNYPQLEDQDVFDKIADIEAKISKRRYNYIPKLKFNPSSSEIKDGDIIAMTVHGRGMDIMHMGIAVHIGDELHFMHASSKGKRVMITDETFKEYSDSIKSNTGYMIVRPLEVGED
jgi:hypothetical protein